MLFFFFRYLFLFLTSPNPSGGGGFGSFGLLDAILFLSFPLSGSLPCGEG